MKNELESKGLSIAIVAVNDISGASTQSKMTETCSFPVLQDEEGVGAWTLLSGKKDDFYVYRGDGSLAVYLTKTGEVATNLSTPAGYMNVRDLMQFLAMENP